MQDKTPRVMKKETPHSGSLPASEERGQIDAERYIMSPVNISLYGRAKLIRHSAGVTREGRAPASPIISRRRGAPPSRKENR